MAKLPVLLTVIFLLFTLSRSRFTTEADETVTDLPKFDPESATAILLPSERPDFEPSRLLDFKHDADADADAASVTDSGTGIVPSKKNGFHAVNRHFPRRPVVFNRDFRFVKHSGNFNPRFHLKRFVYYGDDMIVSYEGHFDPESGGAVRHIEARWISFNNDGTAKSNHRVGFMKHHHHDHDHEHDLHHHQSRKNKHYHEHDHRHGGDETEKHDGGGFMEKLRRLFVHV